MNAVTTKKFSVAIQGEGYKRLIASTLSDPKRQQNFIAAVSSAVATNPALQECDPGTILSSALLGESLQLAHSPQLGHYYMVPYNDKKRGMKVAQFQLGWKAYVQLATRSGFYRKINVLAIKEGELINFNPLEEEIDIRLIEDEAEREATPTAGYYAMFEYQNGFRKAIYWSIEKMMSHADKYSNAFSCVAYQKLLAGEIPKGDEWKYSSFWYKDFDSMAAKTMLRQLIGKWGIMSIEMTEAYTKDQAAINEDGTISYIDNGDTATVVNEPEPESSLPELSEEDFKAKQKPWFDAIQSGKKTAEQIIVMLKSKYSLSEDQENTIHSWGTINE